MTRKEDVLALAGALLRADARGPLRLELDAGAVLCLVTAIQIAGRDPAARDTLAVRQAVALARKLCEEVASREPELYRFLERGWHEALDPSAGEGEGGER